MNTQKEKIKEWLVAISVQSWENYEGDTVIECNADSLADELWRAGFAVPTEEHESSSAENR